MDPEVKKILYNHISVFSSLKNEDCLYDFLNFTQKLIEYYKKALSELSSDTIHFEVLEEIIKNNSLLSSIIESYLKSVLDHLVIEFESNNKK